MSGALAAEVKGPETMDEFSKAGSLDLQVGDYIVWKDTKVRSVDESGGKSTFVAPNMIGKVIKTSNNPLAQQLRQEGIPIAELFLPLPHFNDRWHPSFRPSRSGKR